MPMLRKSGVATLRGLRHSNGSAWSTALRADTSPKLSTVTCTETSAVQSDILEIVVGTSRYTVLWNGRGPLTQWPERDWRHILNTPGFDLIWDRQPLTSAHLWARYIGNNGHGRETNDNDFRWAVAKAPTSWSVDRQQAFDTAWAKIAPLMAEAESAPLPEVPLSRKAVWHEQDDTTRQVQSVPKGLTYAPDLCAHSNKVKHRSKLWALQHRISLANDPETARPELLEVYKCQWCGGWHVGHKWAA